ncbi:T9SS type A sorting domain-containing protein [Brumimicrobium aurantiacum]|uniref:T9SS C-terminal target domain-containing protein n=1 Tax=Brumimicrobium aurantiacum TaxID=1737063 RepID=A0A3E1EWR4_9FLAO|nr:T9SS type A sorting domain-containing protein [Brumimicrobium aurantiacum]RFC53996.1 T9SS C-terminal target domain-containing protein [Brumimicrobium aurantiacum]
MNKILMLFASILISFSNSKAQNCTNGRYDTEIFSNFSITQDIQYGSNVNFDGSNQNLLLDIYSPSGDTETERPLIIFIHGGSFVFGSKEGTGVVPLAESFAKKGYVTSSINYRLGMNNLVTVTGPSEADASEAVMRATQDARAAVRFFKKSVADDNNPYGIDTTNIYLVGSSAGGFTAINLSFLDQTSEIPSYIDMTDPSLLGGLEGNSGNPGHTSNVKAIVSLAGAIGDTTWMDNNSTPILSLHGDQDGTVPFGTGQISIAIFDIMEVDGSESVHLKADNLGIKNCFKAHYGADHVPHQSSAAYLDTTEQYITQFLLSEVCGETEFCICNTPLDPTPCHNGNGTNSLSFEGLSDKLLMYPNPANNEVHLILEDYAIDKITLLNVNGQMIYKKEFLQSNVVIDVSSFQKGIYFLYIESEGNSITKKLIIE